MKKMLSRLAVMLVDDAQQVICERNLILGWAFER
jgi:hypothetical protein